MRLLTLYPLRAILTLVVTPLALMLLALGVGRALPTLPVLAYEEPRGMNQGDLALMDMTRGLRVKLTRGTALNFNAAWSPDGRRVIFLSLESNSIAPLQLYLLTLGGSPRLLDVPDKLANAVPAWSPDSRSVVYGVINGNEADLAILDVDAPIDGQANPRPLITLPGEDRSPVWSPDGTQIAFVSTRSGNADIFVCNPDGSGVIPLTSNSGEDVGPAWSPDSSQIAYFSMRGTYRQLHVIRRDGSEVRQLTNTLDVNNGRYWSAPVWSPDGLAVAYQNIVESVSKIVVSRIDGSGDHRLTRSMQTELFPLWLPDGEAIFYVGLSALKNGIYMVDGVGSTVDLTFDSVTVSAPVLWQLAR